MVVERASLARPRRDLSDVAKGKMGRSRKRWKEYSPAPAGLSPRGLGYPDRPEQIQSAK
jgi:hypothetical protein